MTDTISRERRSWLMSRVGQKHTPPELAVRRAIYKMGYRFRLHRKDLPGRPDVVLPRLRKVIFVHGCFWHRHPKCGKATTPKSNLEYWQNKFAANEERDKKAVAELTRLGWASMIVWECQTRDINALAESLSAFLRD